MELKFKMDYLKKIYQRYHKSSRQEKKQMLNEFCEVCRYNRKYAIWLLNEPPKDDKPNPAKKRNYTYGHRVISILETIWETAGYPWSTRLKSALPLWIPWCRQRFHLTPELEQQLFSISAATIDRRLKPKKYRIKKRIYNCTRPGTLLKHQIPIKTDNWDVNEPGLLEIDLVAHCGSSAEGDFVYSLNCTDIHTTWTGTRAIMGKSQFETFQALKKIIDSFPFPIKGIDSDNGSEFINWHLVKFCNEHNIQFTRSRPYKKDDNAHIEQKNWTHVRKIFGYVRYDSEQSSQSMNDLYSNELHWFQNFFQPSVKLVKKIRIGSKLKRVYDSPKTPFQRLCACKEVDRKKLTQLKNLFVSIDPFELSKTIDKKLNRIYQMRTRRIKIQRSFEERFNAELKKDIHNYNFRYI